MKKIKPSTLRMLCIIAVVVVVAIGYFTHIGIGNLSGFGWDAFAVICPLGYLESLLASRTFIPRALISFAVIVVAVLVLGRVFCAWICPMPLLQRWIPGMKKRAEKRTRERRDGDVSPTGGAVKSAAPSATENPEGGPVSFEGAPVIAEGAKACPASSGAKAKLKAYKPDSRLGVLLGALASAAIFGFPVFCLICPVGLTFATVLVVMRLFAYGDVSWTVVVVPLVLILEVVFLRKWCKKICPLGALVSLISGANKTLRPIIDNKTCLYSSKGASCFECSKACPEHIDVRRPELSAEAASECTKCRECAHACPVHAITFPFLPKKAESVEVAGSSVREAQKGGE